MCYLQFWNITFPVKILEVLIMKVLISRMQSWDTRTQFPVQPSPIIFIIQREPLLFPEINPLPLMRVPKEASWLHRTWRLHRLKEENLKNCLFLWMCTGTAYFGHQWLRIWRYLLPCSLITSPHAECPLPWQEESLQTPLLSHRWHGTTLTFKV